MVHLYRALVYLAMIGVAVLLYMLLRRLFRSRTRVVPLVGTLLAATGLLWCTYVTLSKPALLRKYAPILRVKKQGAGKNMVYMQNEVRVCAADGSRDTIFLPTGFITTRDVTWSPDGTRVACSRVRDSGDPDGNGAYIYTYDAGGGDAHQVTSDRGISRRPSWSPDGTRIAFDHRSGLRQAVTEIYLMNADGSDRRRLTDKGQVHAYHPVWSPDGRSIYFCAKIRGRDDIWIMDADGGNMRPLTNTPAQSETEPAISPDGSTLAIAINRREVFLMDTEDGRLTPLKAADGRTCRGRDPSWTPDGERILYAGFGADNSRKFIMEIKMDGTGLQQIPVLKGRLLNPVLSPDGSRLAYLRYIKSVVRKATTGGTGM